MSDVKLVLVRNVDGEDRIFELWPYRFELFGANFVGVEPGDRLAIYVQVMFNARMFAIAHGHRDLMVEGGEFKVFPKEGYRPQKGLVVRPGTKVLIFPYGFELKIEHCLADLNQVVARALAGTFLVMEYALQDPDTEIVPPFAAMGQGAPIVDASQILASSYPWATPSANFVDIKPSQPLWLDTTHVFHLVEWELLKTILPQQGIPVPDNRDPSSFSLTPRFARNPYEGYFRAFGVDPETHTVKDLVD